MDYPNECFEHDHLRARFTRFLEVMVKRARLNYIQKCRRYPETIPLEYVSEELLATKYPLPTHADTDSFSFEEERLADAFNKLPLMRQKMLTLLFVEELTPLEIAQKMNCSVGHVYNQRSLALQKLRQLLQEGGDEL